MGFETERSANAGVCRKRGSHSDHSGGKNVNNLTFKLKYWNFSYKFAVFAQIILLLRVRSVLGERLFSEGYLINCV